MFNVGDRVRYIRDGMSVYGKYGTVCAIRRGDGFNISHVGIRFDKSYGGHSCNGTCPRGYGYWARPWNLVLLNSHIKIR